MNTVKDIVVGCENYLGWTPDYSRFTDEPWRVHVIEVGKLKRAMARNPAKFTLANLALALEYSRRKRMTVRSPIGLLGRVDEALKRAVETEADTDIDTAIRVAVAWEYSQDDPESARWSMRLLRSQGAGRRDVLNEWKETGRGE